jgi:anti-sigma regulatory factor (Ser/Thr protein kinase)
MEPAQAVQLDGSCSRSVRLAVSPKADFRQIIHTFDAIEMPRTRVSVENIRFAILELVNNSLRAHREKGEERDILVSLAVAAGRFSVAVRDFGGGFDPRRLPYDLDADPAGLDLHSAPFEEYQKRNGYKRFGMGIIVARKTFDSFHLQFLDERDMPSPFVLGRIVGTLISLGLATAQPAAGARSAVDARPGGQGGLNGN